MASNGWDHVCEKRSWFEDGFVEWGWAKGMDVISARAPDIRTAMVKSAVKALREEKGE